MGDIRRQLGLDVLTEDVATFETKDRNVQHIE